MTVRDLLTMSLQRIGIAAPGETPTPEDLQTAFDSANLLVDALAVERLTIFTITRTTWTIVNGTQTYTVGTGGTVNVARPIFVDHVAFQDTSVSPVLERELTMLTDDEWAAIGMKTLTNTYPSTAYYNPTYGSTGRATLSLWMVPTSTTLQGVLYAPAAVTQFATLDDVIALPPGYPLFLRENFAVHLGTTFGRQPDPLLLQSAVDTKANIKRANIRLNDMQVDRALVSRHRGYSIITDGAP